MPTTGTQNKDLSAYLVAWAEMMIEIWQEKLILMDVNDTWELYNSFTQHVYAQSGGDSSRINFAFREYGFYVNSGVGKEVYVGNPGDLEEIAVLNVVTGSFYINRQPKPWFDKGWYRSVYALRRDVARIYGEAAAKNIVFYLNSIRADGN